MGIYIIDLQSITNMLLGRKNPLSFAFPGVHSRLIFQYEAAVALRQEHILEKPMTQGSARQKVAAESRRSTDIASGPSNHSSRFQKATLGNQRFQNEAALARRGNPLAGDGNLDHKPSDRVGEPNPGLFRQNQVRESMRAGYFPQKTFGAINNVLPNGTDSP